MNARLTRHASEQLAIRGIATSDEVLAAVNSKAAEIQNVRQWEARVIVKRLAVKVVCPDGSNGDTVLACVDPRTLNVKTVMLQRYSQVERKARMEVYL